MDTPTQIALYLALSWGVLWAVLIQFIPRLRWLVNRRTWVTVVVGIGGDLFIAYWIIPFDAWIRVFGVVTLSSVGIIIRSFVNEHAEHQELERINADQDAPTHEHD